MSNKELYFSTTVELKMNGVTYRPAMCYKIPPFAKKSLQLYADEGKVKFHDELVHFVNGAIAHMTKEIQTPAVESIVKEVKTTKKKAE